MGLSVNIIPITLHRQQSFIIICFLKTEQLLASGYYSKVQALIEQMYKDGGNKKVTLVAHSMGGQVTLYFLNNIVTQSWKDTYIHAFITLAGVWSGGSYALQTEISGRSLKAFKSAKHVCTFPSDIELQFRAVARTFPSTAWFLPRPSVWGNEVIVTTPRRSYTALDYEELFGDMGYPQGYDIYKGVRDINAKLTPPNVRVYCMYGTGVDTPESYVYDQGFPDSTPQVKYGDGDGTVNRRSAEACLKWESQQRQSFKSRAFPRVQHGEIVKSNDVFNIMEEVTKEE